MTAVEFECIWEYFLVLDEDLNRTTRYVEPTQKDVYSIEFAKIIILTGSEIETAFKNLCSVISGAKSTAGNIGEYKAEILTRFPQITQASVIIGRTRDTYKPFEGWDKGTLYAWDVYQDVKHMRATNFESATYKNAERILAILYILILYLAHEIKIQSHLLKSQYIRSDYAGKGLTPSTDHPLPDFIVP